MVANLHAIPVFQLNGTLRRLGSVVLRLSDSSRYLDLPSVGPIVLQAAFLDDPAMVDSSIEAYCILYCIVLYLITYKALLKHEFF